MKDIKGQKFGRLLVLEKTEERRARQIVWQCQCDCGNLFKTTYYQVNSGRVKSCGCYNLDRVAKMNPPKHGMNQTRTYHSWEAMKSRCNNPNNASFSYYGELGISYDPSWESFEAFYKDMGDRPEGTSLDRINPFGNYSSSNCRWATPKEQANNQRRHYVVGEVMPNVLEG